MITIEQIDEFRKRTNSSYEDAKYYLEKNNGDILDAIIDFERTKAGRSSKYQEKKQREDYGRRFADILQKGFDTRIFVEDKNSTLFTIPVILLILLIPLWVIVLLFFVFLMLLGYKFSIRDVKSQNVNVGSFFQNLNEKLKETGANKEKGQGPVYHSNPSQNSENKAQVPVPKDVTQPVAPDGSKPEQNKEEGYKEYTIE